MVLYFLASPLGLPPAQLQPSLDALMSNQLAELEVTESGTLVYVFPELQVEG